MNTQTACLSDNAEKELRNDWSRGEVSSIFNMPFNDLLFRAHSVHRQNFDPNAVQVSTLLSIKTGGCPEDCKYCPQSSLYNTEVESDLLMKKGKLINSEPEKEKIAGFNYQTEKWIDEFSSYFAQDNISEIIDQVRAKEFSRAKVLINRKWEETINTYSPFVSFFKRIPPKYFI